MPRKKPTSKKTAPKKKVAAKPVLKKTSAKRARTPPVQPIPPPPEPEPLAEIPSMPSSLDVISNRTRYSYPSRELTIAICYLIRTGNTVETACRAMGVSRTLIGNWIRRGINELEDRNSPYGQFVLALDTADAQDEVQDLQSITSGAKHWQALAWKRERKTSTRWGARSSALSQELPIIAVKEDAPEHTLETSAEILAILEAAGIAPSPASVQSVQSEKEETQ